MESILQNREKKIIDVNDGFSVLESSEGDTFNFLFEYAFFQNEALVNNCTSVNVSVSTAAKEKVHSFRSLNIGNSPIIDDILSHSLRSKQRASAANSKIISRKKSDITSKIDNNIASKVTKNVRSSTLKGYATKEIKTVPLKDYNEKNEKIFSQSVDNSSEQKNYPSVISKKMIKKNQDPSNVAWENSKSFSSVSSRSGFLDMTTDNIYRTLTESYSFHSKNDKNDTSSFNGKFVEILSDKVSDKIKIQTRMSFSVNESITRKIYVTFQPVDKNNNPIQTIVKELDLATAKKMSSYIFEKPEVGITTSRSGTFVNIKQKDMDPRNFVGGKETPHLIDTTTTENVIYLGYPVDKSNPKQDAEVWAIQRIKTSDPITI